LTRLSIARSLPLALLGLTLVLAVVAALSVAALTASRQDYEDELARAYGVETAAAGFIAASVIEEALVRSPDASPARRAAAEIGFSEARDRFRAAARDDPASLRLANQATRRGRPIARALARGRRIAAQAGPLMRRRRLEARDEAERASRQATITAAAAGGLALLAAFGLASALIGGLRRPLDDLVGATGRLAAGDLDARVKPAGPLELRDLATSFNAMATDLEGAQGQIERQRRRLATVIESLTDALIVCDGRGVIDQVNPRAGELVPGLRPGRSLAEDPAPLPPLAAALEHEREVEHGGRVLSVQAARLGPRREDGVVLTVRDVSERARLERLKSEFVATASHELRSPLTSIKGFVELLEASPSLTARQREFVEIVLLSTNRLVDLVNDLLDVARVEAGRLEIQPRPTSIPDVVEEVATLMRPRIEDARQRLEVDVEPGVPAARADPARVRQIITNLLTNAHLYTPARGRLAIRVRGEEDRVSVAVSDTGQGMDAGQLERIFDRFYRAGPTSGGGPSGSGLGLSIVRSLVDLHGGSIDVKSAPGRGTTFTVRLPRATVRDARSTGALLKGRRVLVVDDDPAVARLIADQLDPWDVETVLVGSGEAAIERLRTERFDAVTLDILMGGMSGFEVLRAVREDPDLRDTAVVVVSVFSGREALAGEWVVSKPIDADELTGALGSAMLAGRTRVLVVGREAMRPRIGVALERLEIDFDWVASGPAAARMCERRRYEVALVDAGLESPQRIVAALDLRGRRERRAVLVFSDGAGSPGLARLDAAPVRIEDAGAAVLAALGQDADAG